MDISSLLGIVIELVIIGVIFWVVMWFVDFVGIPEPFHKIIIVIVGIVALVIVVSILLGLMHTGSGAHFKLW